MIVLSIQFHVYCEPTVVLLFLLRSELDNCVKRFLKRKFSCIQIHTYMYVHANIYVRMYVCMYATCTYICMYVHTVYVQYVCMHAYVLTYIL